MTSGALSTAEIADALKRARELAAGARSEDSSKRHHEDNGGSPPKKMNLAGNPITALGGNTGLEPFVIEQFQVPDSCVGLIIGRGGESITQIQHESGCRVQMSQNKDSMPELGGKPVRCCTLTGAPEAVEKAKQLIQNIISRAGESLPPVRTGANAMPLAGSVGSGGGGGTSPLGSMSFPGLGVKPITTEVMIPATKCGLIIGKGGETIKQLQEKAGVRMMMVQDTCQPTGMPKPLRIIGEPTKVEYAKQLVEEIMNSKHDNVLYADEYGSMSTDKRVGEVIVPKHAVGVIIGKNGDTIRKLTTESGAKIQFRPDESHTAPERTAIISGTVEQIQKATQLITDLVTKSGDFQGTESDVYYVHVPSNKTGLVIGKGGETIKQINNESGARVELSRDPAPNEFEKVFVIRGTPQQITHAHHLIRIKVGDVAAGTPVPSYPAADQSGYQQLASYAATAGNAAAGSATGAIQDVNAAWAAYYAQYYQGAGLNAAYPMAAAAGAADGGSSNATPVANAATANPPSLNPQTGQPDYSAQWAEYYRSMGLHDHANMIEQSSRAIQQQQQPGGAAAAAAASHQLTTASPGVQSYPYAQNQSPYAFNQQSGVSTGSGAYHYPNQY